MEFPGEEMYQEAREHLLSLLRLDTSNPPGNEIQAARYLADVFAQAGIWHQVYEPAPGRGSIVARLPGRGEKGALLLMAHLDVVPARAEEWRYPPFAGTLADGAIWGRGALDCKHMVAGWTALLVWLRRLGVPRSREVILAATADEEAGGTWGMGWLSRHHPELLRAEVALNEGGGTAFPLGKATVFACQAAEKGVCWLKITARGPGGHGSVPLPENAVVKLARAMARLGSGDLPLRLTPTVEAMLSAFVEAGGPQLGKVLRQAIAAGGKREDLAQILPADKAATVHASLRNTITPTVLRAGEKTNVIPSQASGEADGRVLPGCAAETFLEEVRELLGEDAADLTLEPLYTALPSQSPFGGPLVETIRRALERHLPGSLLAPYLSTGMTDSRYLRALGIPVYGFWPFLPQAPTHLTHGIDEHLPEDSFRFALRVMWDVLVDFCR